MHTPHILPDKPEQRFSMLKLAFLHNDVTEDEKFEIAVTSLDARASPLVEDEIRHSPTTQKYSFLKTLLINRLGKPLGQQIQILQNEHHGDRLPSEFWRQLWGIVTEE